MTELHRKKCTCFSALSSTLYSKGGIRFSTAFPTSLRNESLAGRQLGVGTKKGDNQFIIIEFLAFKE